MYNPKTQLFARKCPHQGNICKNSPVLMTDLANIDAIIGLKQSQYCLVSSWADGVGLQIAICRWF